MSNMNLKSDTPTDSANSSESTIQRSKTNNSTNCADSDFAKDSGASDSLKSLLAAKVIEQISKKLSESNTTTVSAKSTDKSSKTNSTTYEGSDSAKDSPGSSKKKLTEDKATEGCVCTDVQRSLGCQYSISHETDEGIKEKLKTSRFLCCNAIGQTVWGVLLIIISICGFVLPPLDFVLWESLDMWRVLPPYIWWANPPDVVKVRVYVFNVTNHERFMTGSDTKMNLQEIGPIVYLEKLQHKGIKFNKNNTLTYTAKRSLIYLPDENHFDLNATIIVPNLAVLGMASYLYGSHYLVQTAFEVLVEAHRSQFFLNRTLYEYLWDYRESVLLFYSNIVPSIVPIKNMGFLTRAYANATDQVTVKIGRAWGRESFFQINRYRGQPHLPGYDPDVCPDRIFGSTEGVMYHQRLTKQDILLYWRKTFSRVIHFKFDNEMHIEKMAVYRYNLSEVMFDRVKNGTDCYDTVPTLPAGLSDASKFYFDYPLVVSYPHFYTGSPERDRYVIGLTPDRQKHNSYVVVEPITGAPFQTVIRMQTNLRIHDLSLLSEKYHRFSNHIVPLFWAEYIQEDLPPAIKWTIYFVVVILPPLSIVIFVLTLLLGCFLLARQMFDFKIKRKIIVFFTELKTKTRSKFKTKDKATSNSSINEKETFSIKLPCK